MSGEEEKILEKDIEEFRRERERVRSIIGRIGGKSTLLSNVINLLWILAVIAVFIFSIIMEDTLRLLMIELGVLIVSLKIVYYFRQQSKINHFQFWILSSLEWRLNEITKMMKSRLEKTNNNVE